MFMGGARDGLIDVNLAAHGGVLCIWCDPNISEDMREVRVRAVFEQIYAAKLVNSASTLRNPRI